MKSDDNLTVRFCPFRFGFLIPDHPTNVFDWHGVVLMGWMGRNGIFNGLSNFAFAILES